MTIVAVIGYDASANGLNIDGAVKGALEFTIPAGWSFRVRCVNRTQARYACVLVSAPEGKHDLPSGVENRPLPAGALAPGAARSFTIAPSGPGLYRLGAETAGHQPAGMWVSVAVTIGARPSARWLR